MSTRERRNYYRINYPVGLEYKRVDKKAIMDSPEPKEFNVSPYFTLQLRLAELDTQISQMITKVNDAHPAIATCLSILNEKTDLIGASLSRGELDVSHAQVLVANISESGMEFRAPDKINLGEYLALKIVFPNDSLGLLVYAEVIRSQSSGEHFDIGVKFLKMPERCRALLARTIIKAQMRERQTLDLDDDTETRL